MPKSAVHTSNLEATKTLTFASSFCPDKTCPEGFVQDKIEIVMDKIFVQVKNTVFPVKILFLVEYEFLSKEKAFWMTFMAKNQPFHHGQK